MKSLFIALRIFLFFTILTGVIYPLIITGFAQIVFPSKANGSIIVRDNKAVGSKLIGQQFDTTIYFSSRPSAVFYNTLPSGGSNYGIINIKLKNLVAERKHQFITFNQLDTLTVIPSEMLFASASGLDPHISPGAALLQLERVARARNFNDKQRKQLEEIIKKLTEAPVILGFGEDRINVLLLNFETDRIR
jgi:potassium-transporting ATPase KdpC subunit